MLFKSKKMKQQIERSIRLQHFNLRPDDREHVLWNLKGLLQVVSRGKRVTYKRQLSKKLLVVTDDHTRARKSNTKSYVDTCFVSPIWHNKKMCCLITSKHSKQSPGLSSQHPEGDRLNRSKAWSFWQSDDELQEQPQLKKSNRITGAASLSGTASNSGRCDPHLYNSNNSHMSINNNNWCRQHTIHDNGLQIFWVAMELSLLLFLLRASTWLIRGVSVPITFLRN